MIFTLVFEIMKNPKPNEQLPTLLQAFDEDNELFHLRVGVDRSKHSYNIMVRARGYVADFLQSWEQRDDIPLEELQLEFLQRFSMYLSVERNLHRGTIWLNCMMLKGVVQRAYKRGLISASPFAEFHIPKNIGEREFLTEKEVQLLIDHSFSKPIDAYVRDVFVFSALTGMSFVDIRHLKKSEIQEIEGNRWIVSERKKTGIPFRVRLMKQPQTIIRRYESQGREDIFDRCEYHTIAKHLPIVLRECGISKRISFHCARHTFAIMALNSGMPIESVSRILGHSNITTTQIYAKVTMKKLDGDFLRMEKQLIPVFTTKNKESVVRKLKRLVSLFFASNNGLIRAFSHT